MREKLIELLTDCGDAYPKATASYLIANGVTVRQKGEWEECDWVEYDGHDECIHYPHEGRVCTQCRNAFKKAFIDNPRVEFCPHCGARMDGDT